MTSKKSLIIAFLPFVMISCSDCSGQQGEPDLVKKESHSQTAASSLEGIDNSKKSETEKLKWESIPLRTDKAGFKQKAASMVGLIDNDVKQGFTCGNQAMMLVPDIANSKIVERSAGKRTISNCVLRPAVTGAPTLVNQIKAKFIDEKIAVIEYVLKAGSWEKEFAQMNKRFGEGNKISLEDEFIGSKVEYVLWRFDDDIWLLSKGQEQTTILINQDMKASLELSAPKPILKPGQASDLKDLGLGKLDLDEKEEEIDLSEFENLKNIKAGVQENDTDTSADTSS